MQCFEIHFYLTRSKALAECQEGLLHHRMRHEVCKLKLSYVRKLLDKVNVQ